jgi:hypothetical protein
LPESPNPPVEEFITTFDLIHGVVVKNYCHFENKNIDPQALYDKYLVKSNAGLNEITLNLGKPDSAEPSGSSPGKNIKAEILEEDTGYIAITSMTGNLAEFEEEYSKVAHLPCLIVDVRGNGGGKFCTGHEGKRKGKYNCCSETSVSEQQSLKNGYFVFRNSSTWRCASARTLLKPTASRSRLIWGITTAGSEVPVNSSLL